ncbi:MAG TPA: FAD-dependent thymidylate synthase [Chloroflexota bacterium]|nr:FAD-dependent thymidylate synthase [Chloroflexota bacterium]
MSDVSDQFNGENTTVERGKTIAVLNLGYCRLVDWMGDDLSVTNAARASYMKEVKKLRPADERLIGYLAEHGHTSPFRHAMVQLELKAPFMVARQWFKYRVGSAHSADTVELLGIEIPEALLWLGQGDDGGSGFGDLLQGRNEASRRYVTLAPEFYVPEATAWRSKPEQSKQGSGAPVPEPVGREAMRRLLETIERGVEGYEWALANGICAEQARLFLPAYGLMTVWRWTASVQGVAHFLKQRLADDAQAEIQQYARAVRDLVLPLFPHSLPRLMRAMQE